MQMSEDENQTGNEGDNRRRNYGKDDEVITREEVYYLGKENIEGYACLVNVFLNSLLSSSTNPALINVDNEEYVSGSKD